MLLSTTDRANFVTIGKDRLSVSYHGQGSHAHDVGAVRSEAPFPSAAGHRGSTVHYFEVEILETGTRK
jgi:hypothetical protein